MFEGEFELCYLSIMKFWKAGIFEDMYLHQLNVECSPCRTYCPLVLYPITASNLISIFCFKNARKRSGRILKKRYMKIIRKLILGAIIKHLILKYLHLLYIIYFFAWEKELFNIYSMIRQLSVQCINQMLEYSHAALG